MQSQPRISQPNLFADALARTLRQIPEWAFLKVLLWGVSLAALTLGFAVYGAEQAISMLPQFDTGWVGRVVAWAVGFAALWAAFILFVPVSAVFTGLFLDDVVDAVEARYYPGCRSGARLGMVTATWLGVRLGLHILLFNLVALPLYVLTFWIPFLPVVIFYALNSYLIGRGYYELVAARHLGVTDSDRHGKGMRGRILLAGLLVTAFFTVPLLNLMAPILGAAFLVHIFHASLPRAKVES